MAYNLEITDRAEELLDGLVCYLLYQKKNKQAAMHLLDSVEHIYNRLEENPFQFPDCRDEYLLRLGYKEAGLADMNYLIIFRLEGQTVYVLGIFHELEQYANKL
jgi:plasmid stabilization system protein ParE